MQLFIGTLLSKNHPVSQRVSCLTNSIGQDIIYNLTKGKQKTVKHVQLGIVTKRKTGSKFMINSLNRFGHSISYDEVNNIETFFAEMQANKQSHQSFLPNNIQPSTFIIFVYDNCDHNPETISGMSLHCTNGIIIQAPGLPKETLSSEIMCEAITRPRKRLFKALTNNDKPVYRQPKKQNPENVLYVEIDNNLIHQVNSKKEDLIWILASYKSSEFLSVTETVPGWTEFYHLVLRKNAASPTNKVFYLPSIDKSPTKISTVYEILFQVKAKAEALSNTEADLVLDHAIYCKAF